MFTAAKQDRFKAYLGSMSVVVLTAFLGSSVFLPQRAFAQVFNLSVPETILKPAVNLPLNTRLNLPFKLNPNVVELYDGNLKPMLLKGEKFFLTGASFYWPGEGKASREHMGTTLTPGISVANLDLPLGTVLDIYNPNTGEFLYRKVVADRGPFGVEKIQVPLIGPDDRQVIKDGQPVFKTMVVPRRDDDGNLVRNAHRGIDIQVATAKEAYANGERPVLLKIVWQPKKKKPEAAEPLPTLMMDKANHVYVPFNAMRVLDVRSKRVVLEDKAGRLLNVWGLKDIKVKVGDHVNKGQLLAESTDKTVLECYIDGVLHPMIDLIALHHQPNKTSTRRMRLTFALVNYKFIREEAGLTS